MDFSLGPMQESKELEDTYDLIIIGGGPAGLTAAIYARRSGLSTLVVEPLITGGNIASTEKVDNWPGDADGVSGENLAVRFTKHAERFGTEFSYDDITEINLSGNEKVIKAGNKTFKAKAIIIATGTHPREINVPGEKEYKGHGISYCATCDAPFFKDKDIIVIGAGNSSIEESIYLLTFVKSITFIQDLPYITAEKILADEIMKKDNVKFYFGHLVKEFKGDGSKLTSVVFEDRKTGETKEIKTDGCFVYIGLIPNTKLFKGQVELDKYGYVMANEDTVTSAKGVFAAGDVRIKTLRQIVTAVSDGAIAAYEAKKYIDELKGGN
ncbi:MAG: thioredoxin-disulfide reductase [Proteobacteria bacterium]|nr:thioredoxin-disulfide reductase [Pseudomonadota bacterium]